MFAPGGLTEKYMFCKIFIKLSKVNDILDIYDAIETYRRAENVENDVGEITKGTLSQVWYTSGIGKYWNSLR